VHVDAMADHARELAHPVFLAERSGKASVFFKVPA
jgi:hypothetical protein